MRLDPDGVPRWSEPRAIWVTDDLRITGSDAGLAIVGHPDGTAHAIWADDVGNVSVMGVDAEGGARWEAPVSLLPTPTLSGDFFSDGAGGLWAVTNNRMGHVQHIGPDGWQLFRTWFIPGCGEAVGFAARAGPDAEPFLYFHEMYPFG